MSVTYTRSHEIKQGRDPHGRIRLVIGRKCRSRSLPELVFELWSIRRKFNLSVEEAENTIYYPLVGPRNNK